jgi:hypothetical protein
MLEAQRPHHASQEEGGQNHAVHPQPAAIGFDVLDLGLCRWL